MASSYSRTSSAMYPICCGIVGQCNERPRSAMGPGRVKTQLSRRCIESFSQLLCLESSCQQIDSRTEATQIEILRENRRQVAELLRYVEGELLVLEMGAGDRFRGCRGHVKAG